MVRRRSLTSLRRWNQISQGFRIVLFCYVCVFVLLYIYCTCYGVIDDTHTHTQTHLSDVGGRGDRELVFLSKKLWLFLFKISQRSSEQTKKKRNVHKWKFNCLAVWLGCATIWRCCAFSLLEQQKRKETNNFWVAFLFECCTQSRQQQKEKEVAYYVDSRRHRARTGLIFFFFCCCSPSFRCLKTTKNVCCFIIHRTQMKT